MLRHLDLFSGIGGFALAARMVGGYETVAFCEIEPYCQAVLRKHWPGVPIYEDVRALAGIDGRVDIITGGFPCQDISIAGKGAGIDGERSGLWSEYLRLIRELRPRYAVVENVTALLDRGVSRVLGDLAAVRYDAQWRCVRASALGAWHRRNRIWIVAHPYGDRDLDFKAAAASLGYSEAIEQWRGGLDELGASNGVQRYSSYAGIRRVVHGIPDWVDRMRGLGNAVVPQVAAIFLQAIKECEEAQAKVRREAGSTEHLEHD